MPPIEFKPRAKTVTLNHEGGRVLGPDEPGPFYLEDTSSPASPFRRGFVDMDRKYERLRAIAPDLAELPPGGLSESEIDARLVEAEARQAPAVASIPLEESVPPVPVPPLQPASPPSEPVTSSPEATMLRTIDGDVVCCAEVAGEPGQHYQLIVGNTSVKEFRAAEARGAEAPSPTTAAIPLTWEAIQYLRNLVGYPEGRLAISVTAIGGGMPALSIVREGQGQGPGQLWTPVIIPLPPALIRALYEDMVGDATGKLLDATGQLARRVVTVSTAALGAVEAATKGAAALAEASAHAPTPPAFPAGPLQVEIVSAPPPHPTEEIVHRDGEGNISGKTVKPYEPPAPPKPLWQR